MIVKIPQGVHSLVPVRVVQCGSLFKTSAGFLYMKASSSSHLNAVALTAAGPHPVGILVAIPDDEVVQTASQAELKAEF